MKYTKTNAPIPQSDKVSVDSFMKTVWQLSRTNLHYLDFKAEFGEELKRMFRPVRLPNPADSAAP